MSRVTSQDMDEIAEFVIAHYSFKATEWKQIRWLIAQHAEYDTMMVVRDDKEEIVAVARWNILPNGTDMVILDVIIRPDHRHGDLNHRMILKGLDMYPKAKNIMYERRDKGRGFVKIPISRFLKRRF